MRLTWFGRGGDSVAGSQSVGVAARMDDRVPHLRLAESSKESFNTVAERWLFLIPTSLLGEEREGSLGTGRRDATRTLLPTLVGKSGPDTQLATVASYEVRPAPTNHQTIKLAPGTHKVCLIRGFGAFS